MHDDHFVPALRPALQAVQGDAAAIGIEITANPAYEGIVRTCVSLARG